ncbi:helix-turn-helix transcriptional regulator [Leucobacter viscericola]|uniref:Helix-turn-helix transcriptional regulator n=1 Tax=Leucobacter viscericola TaxID=2714935 RepID=A0A6G7XIA5_9MICO|nr:helix-turn-helix transcriptional regulator [Leucobacter viscericola]QIK64107.1 helix-turn-helix transcriptional regulator [Leucobacter viscericola]
MEKKGRNARNIGPMSLAIAAELRAAIARAGYNVKMLSDETRLPLSTLHKTLKGQRAIDVEDVLVICDHLGLEPGDIMNAAAQYARQNTTGGPSAALTEAVERNLGNVTVGQFGQNDPRRESVEDDMLAVASERDNNPNDEHDNYDA